jgi:lipopolysaccharide/colanic/teichoic acid biosynthesis glycosyltransferase
MDIAGGLVGCFATLLICLLIGPIILIKSPGNLFYSSERIGLNGKRFKMYKFRSMIPNAEALKTSLAEQNIVKDGMMFKIKDDPRIIPGIGNFIRKTSLDEFPQFFNVLKGDMSLVGTRPPTVDEWEKYKPEHRMRMSIKPGLTGMWQISGRNKIVNFDDVVKLDKEYIDNWDLGLDIKILFKTVVYLFSRKDDAM